MSSVAKHPYLRHYPDHYPYVYNLFGNWQNSLDKQGYYLYEAMEINFSTLFPAKPKDFYKKKMHYVVCVCVFIFKEKLFINV